MKVAEEVVSGIFDSLPNPSSLLPTLFFSSLLSRMKSEVDKDVDGFHTISFMNYFGGFDMGSVLLPSVASIIVFPEQAREALPKHLFDHHVYSSTSPSRRLSFSGDQNSKCQGSTSHLRHSE